MRAGSIDEVWGLFERWGGEGYDEQVSQLAHALQTAALAEADDASDPLVAAALLHDVAHLLEKTDQRPARARAADLRHEARGANYLASLFGAEVTAPIALHVAAKRYLCAVEPGYRVGLSSGSHRSLELQGGPFEPTGEQTFETTPGWADAVRLRRWDDRGKIEGLGVPTLEHYRPVLERVLQ
jgi:phosphonate degradation associated HDIG domain protein